MRRGLEVHALEIKGEDRDVRHRQIPSSASIDNAPVFFGWNGILGLHVRNGRRDDAQNFSEIPMADCIYELGHGFHDGSHSSHNMSTQDTDYRKFKKTEVTCNLPLHEKRGRSLEYQDKIAMTRMGDASIEACAERVAVARAATGLSKTKFCKEAGVGLTSFLNAEAGRSYPSRAVMLYLHRNHRIDFNFILHGDFQQLPSDVQSVLIGLYQTTAEMKRSGLIPDDQKTVELEQLEQNRPGRRPG